MGYYQKHWEKFLHHMGTTANRDMAFYTGATVTAFLFLTDLQKVSSKRLQDRATKVVEECHAYAMNNCVSTADLNDPMTIGARYAHFAAEIPDTEEQKSPMGLKCAYFAGVTSMLSEFVGFMTDEERKAIYTPIRAFEKEAFAFLDEIVAYMDKETNP